MNVIIFGSVDWSESWQMHHQLATSHQKSGDRVLYIDNLGVRTPNLRSDGKRVLRKIRESWQSNLGFQASTNGITILRPLVIPLPYNTAAQKINSSILSRKIRKWTEGDWRAPLVVYTFLPTPLALKTIEKLSPTAVIYFCANRMVGKGGEKLKLVPSELKLLSNADLVITISEALTRYAQSVRGNGRMICIPPGLDPRFVKSIRIKEQGAVPKELIHAKRPIAGFLGTILPKDERFNEDLVIRLATSIPEASFVLVGPCYGDARRMRKIDNIYLVGSKPHEEVGRYLSEMQVGLIPYQINEYTDSVSTCKVYEYLAYGLQVVGTPMEDLVRFERENPGVVSIESTYDGFEQSVRESLFRVETDKNKEHRIFVALSHTWESRFGEIQAALQAVMKDANTRMATTTNCHGETFASSLLAEKVRLKVGFVLALISVLAPLLVATTSIVSVLEQRISARGKLDNHDGIIITLGDGELEYYNRSFIKRAADLLHLSERGIRLPSVVIVSSTRDGRLSEANIVKNALRSSTAEYPREVVSIKKQWKTSWDHAQLINHEIRERRLTNVAVLSSPIFGNRFSGYLKTLSDEDYIVDAIVVADESLLETKNRFQRLLIVSREYAALFRDILLGRIRS